MNPITLALSLPLSFAALFQNVNIDTDQLKYALFLGPDPDLQQQEEVVEDTGFFGEVPLASSEEYETTSFSGELTEHDMRIIIHTAYPNGGLYTRLPTRQGYTNSVDYYYYLNKEVAIHYNKEGLAIGYSLGY